MKISGAKVSAQSGDRLIHVEENHLGEITVWSTWDGDSIPFDFSTHTDLKTAEAVVVTILMDAVMESDSCLVTLYFGDGVGHFIFNSSKASIVVYGSATVNYVTEYDLARIVAGDAVVYDVSSMHNVYSQADQDGRVGDCLA